MYSSRAPWRLCMKVGTQQASILRKSLLSRRRVSWQRRVACGCNCCSPKKCLPISPGSVPFGMLQLLHIRRGFCPRQLSGPYTTCLIANSQFSNYGRCRIVRLSRSRRCNGNFKTRSGRRNCSIPEENTRGCRSSRLHSKACNGKSVIEIEKLRSSRVNWKPSSALTRK